MSRVGGKPIRLPEGVEVKIENTKVIVRGPKGELTKELPRRVKIVKKDNQVSVERHSEGKRDRALHGLSRSLLQNMVVGVSHGFEKSLEIVGVGYKVTKKGKGLEIQVGYSHPVVVSQKEGIEFEVPAPTKIIVKGIDKQLVGEVAAEIRAARRPEPYKGKGIRYEGEYVRRKAGKTAK